MITYYSFRAKSITTVAHFILAVSKANEGMDVRPVRLINCHVSPWFPLVPLQPDVTVEFKSLSSLTRLRDIVRKVPGSDVILQTLRPLSLAENPLDRDLTIR